MDMSVCRRASDSLHSDETGAEMGGENADAMMPPGSVIYYVTGVAHLFDGLLKRISYQPIMWPRLRGIRRVDADRRTS